MAEVGPMTEQQRAEWSAWVASRPPSVRRVAERFWPNRLYRMRDSRCRVTIYAFDEHEDGSVTLKVDVTGEYNLVAFERRVFGVSPDNLEECELPKDGEQLGSLDMNPDQFKRLSLQARGRG
jgi:hypothetical protein